MISLFDFFWREGDTPEMWGRRVREGGDFIEWLYRRHQLTGEEATRWQPWYLIDQYAEWEAGERK